MLLSGLPFASVLTLAARAAHRAARGLFRSRSTIVADSQEAKDHPSWPTGPLVRAEHRSWHGRVPLVRMAHA